MSTPPLAFSYSLPMIGTGECFTRRSIATAIEESEVAVQVVLCDICNQPISGSAVEMHLFHGDVALNELGVARVITRDGSSMTFLCEICASWTKEAMAHLRNARAAPPRRTARSR